MNITRDAVIDAVYRAVTADTATALVTSQKLRVASLFPAVEIRQIGKTTTRTAIPLDFLDTPHTLDFEAQVFTDDASGGLTNALRIMEIIENTMFGLYFRETMNNEVENQDPEISRVVARFSRQVCDGDAIPTVAANDDNN